MKGSSLAYNKIIGQEDFIINDIVRKRSGHGSTEAYVRAGVIVTIFTIFLNVGLIGPRAITHFDPKNVRAAIVTCGGLCPGLNNVIRDLVHALFHLYDAQR